MLPNIATNPKFISFFNFDYTLVPVTYGLYGIFGHRSSVIGHRSLADMSFESKKATRGGYTFQLKNNIKFVDFV